MTPLLRHLPEPIQNLLTIARINADFIIPTETHCFGIRYGLKIKGCFPHFFGRAMALRQKRIPTIWAEQSSALVGEFRIA